MRVPQRSDSGEFYKGERMGQVINLKETVLDYKPGSVQHEKLRYHALEVLNYIERIECQAIIPEIQENNVHFGDFALMRFNKKLINS